MGGGGGGGGEREKLTGHRSDRCYRQNMVIVTWDPGHTMADRLCCCKSVLYWSVSWGHGNQRLLLSPLVCAGSTDLASIQINS